MNPGRVVEAEGNAACRACGSIRHKQDPLFPLGVADCPGTKTASIKINRNYMAAET